MLTLPIALGCIILPLFLWSIFYSVMRGRRYELDWGAASGSFLVCYALHRKFYWVIFSLSLVGIMMFVHMPYPPISVIFLFAGIYALLFNGFIALFYEYYLHNRYPRSLLHVQTEQERQEILMKSLSNYTGSRYALTLALALSSLLLFLIGLLTSVPAMIER